MQQIILYFLDRDLKKLAKEIEAYPNEDDLWLKVNGVKNSAGSLALHLVGNLNHFVGHIMGGTDYVRDREFEFSGTAISRRDILHKIDTTIQMINEVVPKLSDEHLQKPFEFDFIGERSTLFYLFQFTTHLSYHLGQINYHRSGIVVKQNKHKLN